MKLPELLKITGTEVGHHYTVDDLKQAVRDSIEDGYIYDLKSEITRLKSCLKYEQHLAERIGTHGPGCHLWGPAHYECLIRLFNRLEEGALPEKSCKTLAP